MEAREEAAKKECLANRRTDHADVPRSAGVELQRDTGGISGRSCKEPTIINILILSPNVPIMALTASVMKKVVCSIAEHNEANVSDDASVIDDITNDFQEFLDKYGAMTDQQLKDLGWWPTYASVY